MTVDDCLYRSLRMELSTGARALLAAQDRGSRLQDALEVAVRHSDESTATGSTRAARRAGR